MGFFKQLKELKNLKKEIEKRKQELNTLETEIKSEEENNSKKKKEMQSQLDALSKQLNNKEKTMDNIRDILKAENSELRDNVLKDANDDAEKIKHDASSELNSMLKTIEEYKNELTELKEEKLHLSKDINRYRTQARRFKADIVGIKEFDKLYKNTDNNNFSIDEDIKYSAENLLSDNGLIDSIIKLPLHSNNSKELRKLSNATRKEINNVLTKYESRYTTKGNIAIYNLMIIGLQAEMQLLLFNLKYENLDDSKSKVEDILTKYLTIAGKGNQSILPTITRFISEIKPLYLELIDIEYRHYIKRQQEKEEQQAIREQMKQEAEDKKMLAAERKKLDKEESKFVTEMQRNESLLKEETDSEKVAQLQERLNELKKQLEEVESKKEEITSLSMGKAGYVYIISNMGSFGSDVFKIGMTRRLEPQQRVDELGSASVPFKFDVHALIFSDDAVGLENTLHKRLSSQRVNKVNFRKEFFNSNINDLELLVEEIDPTAEFTKTMLAEEYQQTLVLEKNEVDFAS